MSSTELRLKIAYDALVETTILTYGLYSMRRYKIAQKVGKRIRIVRRENNLTQEELASKVGVHVTTLGRIERGESNPPLQTLNRISQALRVSPKELLS